MMSLSQAQKIFLCPFPEGHHQILEGNLRQCYETNEGHDQDIGADKAEDYFSAMVARGRPRVVLP